MSPSIAQHRWTSLLLLVAGCVVQGPPAVVVAPADAPPRTTPAVAAATPGAAGTRVVDLQYGGSFCALREDGRVACWGYNDNSSLGDGTNEARSRPALVPGLDRVQRLVGMPPLGFCALRADRSLWCWGFAYVGNISMPTAGVGPRPVAERVQAFGFAEKWPGVCAALAKIGFSEALATQLAEEEKRASEVKARLRQASASAPKVLPHPRRIESYVRNLLTVLETNKDAARALLARHMPPLVLTPDGPSYRITGGFDLSICLDDPGSPDPQGVRGAAESMLGRVAGA
jgi:hypothetical protein